MDTLFVDKPIYLIALFPDVYERARGKNGWWESSAGTLCAALLLLWVIFGYPPPAPLTWL